MFCFNTVTVCQAPPEIAYSIKSSSVEVGPPCIMSERLSLSFLNCASAAGLVSSLKLERVSSFLLVKSWRSSGALGDKISAVDVSVDVASPDVSIETALGGEPVEIIPSISGKIILGSSVSETETFGAVSPPAEASFVGFGSGVGSVVGSATGSTEISAEDSGEGVSIGAVGSVGGAEAASLLSAGASWAFTPKINFLNNLTKKFSRRGDSINEVVEKEEVELSSVGREDD